MPFRPISLARHLLNASSIYRVHSPFVFQFIVEVLNDHRHYYAFDQIALLRRQLEADPRVIERIDFGAGRSGRREKVARIARVTAATRAQGERLFRLARFLNSRRILELGTSLGIGTRYLAASGHVEQLITLEGDPSLFQIASEHLGEIEQVRMRCGAFSDTLASSLEQLGQLDLAYLDGDHTCKGTLAYFEACLPYCGPQSCLILDDIHWSADMERAWKSVQQHPSVRLSIDLYRCGMVFFRTEQREKEHFLLYP